MATTRTVVISEDGLSGGSVPAWNEGAQRFDPVPNGGAAPMFASVYRIDPMVVLPDDVIPFNANRVEPNQVTVDLESGELTVLGTGTFMVSFGVTVAANMPAVIEFQMNGNGHTNIQTDGGNAGTTTLRSSFLITLFTSDRIRLVNKSAGSVTFVGFEVANLTLFKIA